MPLLRSGMTGTGAMTNNGNGNNNNTGFGGGRGPWRASQGQGNMSSLSGSLQNLSGGGVGMASTDALLQLKQQIAAGVSWFL